MSSNPRICLVFPPFCESALHGPHLGLPLLRGVLESRSIPTTIIDLNIKTVRSILSSEFLSVVRSACMTSNYSLTEKHRIRASIDHLTSVDLSVFMNSGSIQLKTLLKFVKALLFPHPVDLDQCLTNGFSRPESCTQLYDGFIYEIIATRPNIVGFSVAFSDQLSEAIELARQLRRRSPSIEIWLGGSQINLLQETQISKCAHSGHFDRISLGNGEQSILDMVADYGRPRSKSNVYHSGPMGADLLNQVPAPTFDALEPYFTPYSLPVLATKGCYWGKCTFCDFPKLSDLGGRPHVARDPSLALSEIQDIRSQYGDVKINLISDAIPPSWYRKLCTLAVESDTKLNSWSYMMHSKALKPELFSLMSRAGVIAINFGTESTIDRVLDVMKKQAGYSVIRENLEQAKLFGIRVVTNVIPDYPTTTRDEAFLNANRFQELLPLISSVNPQMFDLTRQLHYIAP